MIKVKRLGYATFETTDLDRLIDYYTQIVGLHLVARDADRAYLGSRMGMLSIVLKRSSRDRCAKLGLEVSSEVDFATGSKRLSDLGIACKAASDPMPGIQRLLSFNDPKDTTIELFTRWSFVESGGGDPKGVGAYKLGHIAFFCPEPQDMIDFYSQVMGFRLSDWIGDYFAFMRCGIDHHSVNFLRGPSKDMQHIAFELHDSTQLTQACDLLGRERMEILWGPVRHGPGHNIATYHRNPADQIIELFCDMDVISDEELGYYDPRPWHRDRPQKPKVWDPAQQRDIWGLPSTPEFRRPAGQKPAA
jgi:catechol 2,3-dioxygenase-like lactoylglutathione lyase family enzyme